MSQCDRLTLKKWASIEGRDWKTVERDLTEILAANGEPPLYRNRLMRLRKDCKPREPEVKALLALTGCLDDFRDDPSISYRSARGHR